MIFNIITALLGNLTFVQFFTPCILFNQRNAIVCQSNKSAKGDGKLGDYVYE